MSLPDPNDAVKDVIAPTHAGVSADPADTIRSSETGQLHVTNKGELLPDTATAEGSDTGKKGQQKKKSASRIGWEALLSEIRKLLMRHGLYVSADGTLRKFDNKGLTRIGILSLQTELLTNLRSTFSVSGDYVMEAIKSVLYQEILMRRHQIVSQVMVPGRMDTANATLAEFLKATTGEVRQTDQIVLLHFIWMVKRTILEMPVENHIMPIFYGPQGIGKSGAVRALISPLWELALRDMKAEILTDERNRPVLTTYLIGLWDELSGLGKADEQLLKQTVTADELSHRQLGGHHRPIIPNCLRLIGTSNHLIANLFKDPTGNRRFYEVHCPQKMNWKVINELDYKSLWRGVDAEGVSPLHGFIEAVQSVQAGQRFIDQYEAWLEYETWEPITWGTDGRHERDLCYSYGRTNPQAGVSTAEMQHRFHRYLVIRGGDAPQHVRLDAVALGRRLSDLQWTKRRLTQGGRRTYVHVPPASYLTSLSGRKEAA